MLSDVSTQLYCSLTSALYCSPTSPHSTRCAQSFQTSLSCALTSTVPLILSSFPKHFVISDSDYVLTFRRNLFPLLCNQDPANQRFDFVISGRSSNDDGYVAMAFAADQQMQNADLYYCTTNSLKSATIIERHFTPRLDAAFPVTSNVSLHPF